MKQLLILTLGLLFAFQTQAQQAQKRYAVESGKIEYKYTGNTTGTKTVYFDDYGEKYYEQLKTVSVTKMFGVVDRTETNKITIINKSHFWTIDKKNDNNMEGELPYYNSSRAVYGDMTEAEQKRLADNLLASFGGKREGTEKILGYTCEKISVMGSFSWIYKGITLKSETNVMGVEVNETAISFEKNISIPASKFKAPAGVDFTNMQQQQQAMFGEMNMNMNMYEEEDDDDYEDDMVPVKYAFADFKSEVSHFNPDGYIRTMVMSQDGQHFALYTGGGYTNVVSVIATAMENAEDAGENEFNDFETFRHNGKTMRYGDITDEEMNGKALIIPYEEHDMYIILMSSPGQDKETLLDWADQLDF